MCTNNYNITGSQVNCYSLYYVLVALYAQQASHKYMNRYIMWLTFAVVFGQVDARPCNIKLTYLPEKLGGSFWIFNSIEHTESTT